MLTHGGYKSIASRFISCRMPIEKHNSAVGIIYRRKHHGIAWFSVNSHAVVEAAVQIIGFLKQEQEAPGRLHSNV